MALMPDKSDPNYKSEMERFKREPESWNKPGLVANVQAPVRPADYKPAPLKPNPGPHEAVERVRRRLLAHYGIEQRLGTAERSVHAAEALFAIAGEDEDKVDFDNNAARNMLCSAGLLS